MQAAADNGGQPGFKALQDMAAKMEAMKQGQAAAAGGGGNFREWEMENADKYRAGDMNDAELGFAGLKNAMKDPSVLGEVAQMLRDPENMAQLKKMMADPAFQQQAKMMAEKMQASGDLPDFSKLQQQAKNMMGGMDPAEMRRLQAENAALKARMGI